MEASLKSKAFAWKTKSVSKSVNLSRKSKSFYLSKSRNRLNFGIALI